MRTSVTKLLVGVTALALGGCSCDPGMTCDDIFVSFESPKDGATGVPATTSVTVKVTDNAGTAVDLDSATLVSRATSATEFSVPREGTVSATGASFTGVTLEPGPNLIKVTVKKKGSACTGTKSITVEVPMTNDAPKVLTMTFPQDTAMPTGTLNSVELPSAGMLRVDLTTQFAIGGTVEIINTATNMPITAAPVNISSSAVSVQIPSAALADGAYTLFARLTKGTLSNTQTGNPDAVKMLVLDRTPPTCMVTAPTLMVVGPNDDADSTMAGYQLRTAATASAKATTIELKLTGGATPQTSGVLTPTNMTVSRDFTVPAMGAVAYTVTAEARDAVGNLCTATKTITVDFECPALTIASPDGGVETSFNVPIVANVTGGNGGTVNWKVTDTSGSRDLGILPTANGVSSGVGSFINGAQTISAQATDAVGNTCPAVTKAFSVNATTGCSVIITRPGTRPGFITAGQAPGGNYNFQATTTCANGASIALKRNGTTISTSAAAGGVVTWTVPVTSGTFKFRAETPAPVVSDELDVTIDLTAPSITQPADTATLNIASDVAPGTPGVQRLMSFVATIPTGGRADICSNQTPAPMGASPCADGAAGWWTLRASATTPDTTFTFAEGAYCLKLVVVSGSTTNVSTPVCITVDGVAPTITNLTLLRDADSNSKLNIAELAGQPPEFRFTLGGSDAQSTIASIELKEGSTLFSGPSAVMYSGASLNVVNVKADQGVTGTSATYNWVIDVRDLAGNVTTTPVQVKIDKVAPTCQVTAPAGGTIGRTSDANMGTAAFDLVVDVTGASDVTAIAFNIGGAQTITTPITTTTGSASNTFALTQTSGTSSYTISAVCSDDSKNTGTATTVNQTIDLTPPTCTMTAPLASPPAHATFTLNTSVTVGGADAVGQTVTVFSQIGAGTPTQVGSLVVSAAGVASGNVTYLNGVQTVTSRVSDPYGNVCNTAPISIDVTAPGCQLSITSPIIGSSGKAYFTSTSISVSANTSNCGAGKNVQLFRVGNGTALGSGTTDASGNVTIAGMLAEGGPYTLRLTIDNGSGTTTDSDVTPVFVDTTPPSAGTVEFNATLYPASGTAITVVAANNANRQPPTPNATFVQDTIAGGTGDFSVKVNGVTGAAGGRVRIVYGGVEYATQNVTTSPQDITFSTVSLPHDTTGTLLVEVIEESTLTFSALSKPGSVDVVAPGAPTVTRTLGANTRAATVTLSWPVSYDDGTNAASLGTGLFYEIRWSTATVANNNALALESDYFDGAKAHPESDEPWTAAGVMRPITLPPNNTYYIAVRARDEVGNYSVYAAPPALANPGTQTILTNPAAVATSYGANAVSNGSLNGDAIDDLVISAQVAAQVHLYLGNGSFAAQAACNTATCQTIDIPVARNPAAETFGNSVHFGKVVAQVDGGAAQGLMVGSSTFNSSQGRAFLFFGGANPDAGNGIDNSQWAEFRGSAASGFGGHVVTIPDVNGDGISEVGIAAPQTGSNRGRFFIFKGRSKAAWLAAAGGTFIPDTTADWVIEGPAPLFGTNNTFGTRLSVSSLGPLTGGPGNDFTISAAHETVNEIYLISSGVLLDAGTVTTGHADAGTPNLAFQTISRPQQGTPAATAFGGAVLGNLDVTGAVAKDLVTVSRKESSLFVYQDGTPATFGSPLITVTGGSNFGASLVAGDFNGDGKPDLVCGESAPVGNPNNVWVLYNRANSYDPVVAQFFQSVFSGTVAVSGAYGASTAVGDFDGDGKPDIALTDRSTGFGRVIVWR